MLRTVAQSLRRNLSPQAYESIRYYFHLGVSAFVPRKPTVQRFQGHADSALISKQLETVNVTAPTQMCRVMSGYGSDKGNGWHNFTTVYNRLFANRRNDRLRIFELGLGTNNPNLVIWRQVINASKAGRVASRLCQLFPSRGRLYGADFI